MASLGGGLDRGEERALVTRGVGLEAIAIEQGSALSKLPCWENVKLSGFGNFQLREKNQRPGRNPKTGEEIPISARRVVTFRPGQKLRARVEAYVRPGN